MSSIAIKGATGVATLGGLGGGIYGIYAYNNTTDTVSNYLTKNGLEIRTDGWDKVLETYKLEKTDTTKIQDSEITQGSVIQDWCTKNLKENIKSTEDSKFQKASQWCIKFKTIKEELTGKQFETNVQTLEGKISGFDTTTQSLIKAIEITDTPNVNKVGKQIQKWCENNSKRRFSNDKETYYKYIKDNCLTATPS